MAPNPGISLLKAPYTKNEITETRNFEEKKQKIRSNHAKASSKRNVLRRPLKDLKSSQDLSSDGRWFHRDGAAAENDRRP